jgi:hypothetical protein
MVVNPWVNAEAINSGEMEVIKTMGTDAGRFFKVVNPLVRVNTPEQRLMDMQPWLEINDMAAWCPFMVVNPSVKADVGVVHMHPYMKVNPFVVVNPWLINTPRWVEMKLMDVHVVNSVEVEVIKTVDMVVGCNFKVMGLLVQMGLGPWLVGMRPCLGMGCAGCPFVVVNPVVNCGRMVVMKTVGMVT